VLFDPFSNSYYRLQQTAYDFVVRLNPRRTIEETWREMLTISPESALGQGEVIELLAQLYQANMLHYALAQDSQKLFDRHQTRERRKVQSALMNILFLRIPLVDPDALLKRILPLINALFSKAGAFTWTAVFIWAVKLAIDNFDHIRDQAEGILAPSNLFLLYVCGFAIKLIHESGHAFAVRRFGGEVHAMGVMFMMLAPLPYTDATASWSFRSKAQRVLVASAGMLFEFFVASIAVIIWANLGGGPAKAVAYNVFFLASVTTVLFNINPLMRFDGYYILADLLDMPNLQQHATQHLQYLLERHVFQKYDATTPAHSTQDALLLGSYGILSVTYKFVLFGGILISVSRHYLLLAVVMGFFLILSWAVMPLIKFVRYVFLSPQLERVRRRAVGSSLAALSGAWLLLALLPVPETFTAPGIVQARHREIVANQSAGRIVHLTAETGMRVKPGDTLLTLENPELDDKIRQSQAAIEQTKDEFRQAMVEHPEDMMPLSRKISALEQELAKLEHDKTLLTVCASQSGLWIAPYAQDLEGRWISKGDSLGEVVDTSNFDFVAVVPQEEVSRLFTHKPRGLSVRLKGQSETVIGLKEARAIPMELTDLPSAALGWYGGGDIEVSPDKGDMSKTVEPFYEIRSSLPRGHAVQFFQGRSGKIRFMLGYSPVLPQGWRKLRQQLQRYYRL